MAAGACVTMTDGERRELGVPLGVKAYLVTCDDDPRERIILLRCYDIQTDTWPCRAFSPQQWERTTPAHTHRDGTPKRNRRALQPDGPDVGADVPGGGAV